MFDNWADSRAGTWARIEAWVVARDVPRARRALRSAARRIGTDGAGLARICDAYRRLGLPLEGLKALQLRRGERLRGSRALWAARLLNAAGAATFARTLAGQVKARSAEDHRILANLHLSFYEPDLALPHFERMRELDPSPDSYPSRVSLVSVCDAWADLGRFGEAESLLAEVRAKTSEPLLLGILGQARGEYLARQGRLDEARAELAAAIRRFPPGDRSLDFAIAAKWLGYVELRLSSDPEQGRAWLRKALEILEAPDVRPEIWLDAHSLWAKADPVHAREVGSLLHGYPLCPTRFEATLGRPSSLAVGDSRAPVRIDLARNEVWSGKKPVFGISKELQLLALARLAMPRALNRETAKALLWPDEAYSYLQLDARLEKLVARLRATHRIRIARRDGWIALDPRESKRISVARADRPEPPSLLSVRDWLEPGEIDRYYGVSRAQRQALLAQWLRRGWIRREGAGAATRYRTIASSDSV